MYSMTSERTEKFKRVADARQGDLTVVLENVHDPHNIGAVLRTCDSVGIHEIYVLYTDPNLSEENIKLGKRSSSGARKWVTVNHYTDPHKCFEAIKKKYQRIFATHLSQDAEDLYQLDLTQPVALLFGNERDGLSETALSYIDGNFIIPQIGMVESLNISVACAVSIYEAYRQRSLKDFYKNNPTTTDVQKTAVLEEYTSRHKRKPGKILPNKID